MNNATSASREAKVSTEATLAKVWCELLEVSEVTADANFFDLGATSMTAIKLLQRVENTFGPGSLSPETIYGTPTLAAMAKSINETIS